MGIRVVEWETHWRGCLVEARVTCAGMTEISGEESRGEYCRPRDVDRQRTKEDLLKRSKTLEEDREEKQP